MPFLLLNGDLQFYSLHRGKTRNSWWTMLMTTTVAVFSLVKSQEYIQNAIFQKLIHTLSSTYIFSLISILPLIPVCIHVKILIVLSMYHSVCFILMIFHTLFLFYFMSGVFFFPPFSWCSQNHSLKHMSSSNSSENPLEFPRSTEWLSSEESPCVYKYMGILNFFM